MLRLRALNTKFGETRQSKFALAEGERELRLVVRGESYGDSLGAEICLTDLVVFR